MLHEPVTVSSTSTDSKKLSLRHAQHLLRARMQGVHSLVARRSAEHVQ